MSNYNSNNNRKSSITTTCADSIITSGIAKGNTNQQIFSTLRTHGHNISYQQLVAQRTQYESKFESSFAAIFTR